MTDKRIKNEQWYIKELVSKISNGDISKPKFQRKKKWDITPKKDSNPNEQSYIRFLFDTYNSVHAITFGQDTNTGKIKFSNIDGNNRINAITHFINRPFEIFPEYLNNLFELLNTIHLDDKNIIIEIKDIFLNISYNKIINIFHLERYFKEINKQNLYFNIKDESMNIEDEILKIQKKLKINDDENFDSNVIINVNLFEGYTTDELCKIFKDINKFNSQLTEIELLACHLFNECNFKINDNTFKTEIQQQIKDYYNDKSNGEILKCYIYNETEQINAYDFIVSFQNLCNQKYKIIEKSNVNGLSLFFKIYKANYGGFNNTFTTKNINDFSENINYSCEILKEIISTIFTDKINDKLFNNSCQKKLGTLTKNNLSLIICCIIGYRIKKIDKSIIKNNIEKCLLYHFMVSDVKDIDKREDFKNSDSIRYRVCGNLNEHLSKKLLSNPENINNNLTINLFNKLINQLYSENNNPHERFINKEKKNKKNDKRRILKFFEKTLMFYYYKQNISTNLLENDFSIEHIFPNSSEWEGELDKDRLGNLIPIISKINSSRGNKHIKNYKNNDTYGFCNFIKDIIPKDNIYDNIITHKNRIPLIKNNKEYNKLCDINEGLYRKNLINCIFK